MFLPNIDVALKILINTSFEGFSFRTRIRFYWNPGSRSEFFWNRNQLRRPGSGSFKLERFRLDGSLMHFSTTLLTFVVEAIFFEISTITGVGRASPEFRVGHAKSRIMQTAKIFGVLYHYIFAHPKTCFCRILGWARVHPPILLWRPWVGVARLHSTYQGIR